MILHSVKEKIKNVVNYLIFVSRIIIGGIFLISSFSKMLNINGFVQIVYKFAILPNPTVPYFAVVIIAIEYVLGATLIAGFYPRQAAFASSILFAIFAIAIGWNLIKKNIVQCGCIDLLFKENINIISFIRDLILLGISITLTTFKNHKFILSNYLVQRNNIDKTLSRNNFVIKSYFHGFCFLLFFILFSVLLFSKISIGTLDSKISVDRNFITGGNSKSITQEQSDNYYFYYGENLPELIMEDYEGNLIKLGDLKGTITIFSIFSPRTFSSLDASLRSVNHLALIYKHKPIRVLLIYRFLGQVEEHDRAEILKIIRTKARVPVIIDDKYSLSNKLKIPKILCPVTIISDQENIVRLAMASTPEYLIHEVIYRILKGDV